MRRARTLDEVEPLSAALKYTFMTGQWAPPHTRARGWVALAQTPQGWPYAEALARAWEVHGAALVAEAAGFDFQPHYITGVPPRGDGFLRWQQAFTQEHNY